MVSYRDSLVGDILGAYEQAFRFDIVAKDEASDIESEAPLEGMVEVLLSKEMKERIRALWSKALIVKVYGRTVGYNYLTFKINALWNPMARMTCVDLGKDFFLIKFNVEEDYDKVLRGGPWFISGHFLAIKPWEPYFKAYFKASEAKFSLVAVGRLGHIQENSCYQVKSPEMVFVGEEACTPMPKKNQEEEKIEANYGAWMLVTRRKNLVRNGLVGPKPQEKGQTSSREHHLEGELRVDHTEKIVEGESNTLSRIDGNTKAGLNTDLAFLSNGMEGIEMTKQYHKKGEESHKFQGSSHLAYGEFPNYEAVPNTHPIQEVRPSGNMLGGYFRDPEVRLCGNWNG
nr:hypothetical protein CFP56_61270 [Quercus suber]